MKNKEENQSHDEDESKKSKFGEFIVKDTIDCLKIYEVSIDDAREFKFYTDDECGKKMNVALHNLLNIKRHYESLSNILLQLNNVLRVMEQFDSRLKRIEQHLEPDNTKPKTVIFGKKVR